MNRLSCRVVRPSLVRAMSCCAKYANYTEKDLLEEVKRDGLLLKHMKNQTPEICLAAVKQNGLALAYVKAINRQRTPEIVVAALAQNPAAHVFAQNEPQWTNGDAVIFVVGLGVVLAAEVAFVHYLFTGRAW